MASCALLCADRAGFCREGQSLNSFGVGEVTGQAFGVIEGRLALQLDVRVMTGDATDTSIIFIVPRTIKDSVRLETNIVEAILPRQDHHLIKAEMAGTTELLRQLVWS